MWKWAYIGLNVGRGRHYTAAEGSPKGRQDCQGQPNREEWPQAESRTDQRMTRGDFQDFSRKIHDEQQLACQNRQANEAMEIDK